MTKGYGVQATTAKGQNALAPTQCFAYVSHDRLNMRDQIKSERVLMRVIRLHSIHS